MANAQGIDVSSFQGAFDWAAEKGSISFALAKATEGATITDPEFARNWQQMKATGLVRGAYCFGHPKNGATTDAPALPVRGPRARPGPWRYARPRPGDHGRTGAEPRSPRTGGTGR